MDSGRGTILCVGDHQLNSTFLNILFLLCGWMFCLHLCRFTMCMGTHGCQKRVSDPLNLELGIVISHHVGAGN